MDTPAPAVASRLPPQLFFIVSAVFHYLGPACAALLFAALAPLGVAWLRIASAALVFAVWRQSWRLFGRLSRTDRRLVFGLGLSLAAMNACFYLAIARLPLATVGAIEFLGPIALAAAGLRDGRNTVALSLAVAGACILTKVRLVGEPVAYLFAFANCGLFVLYVMLGHRIAAAGAADGIDRLGSAMLVATGAALPFCAHDAAPAFTQPLLLLAGFGVGLCSSVIPYVFDQLAMARLPRASFALMLSLLPATATLIGLLVLRQKPSMIELQGMALVIAGVALHRPSAATSANCHAPGSQRPD